jgi:predicted nucleic acid-binding protein
VLGRNLGTTLALGDTAEVYGLMISGLTMAGTRIVMPSHFWLEVINALLTRRQWTGERVLEAVHALDQFEFETMDLDRGLIILSLDVGERYGLTSYDAAYVAFAISMDGAVATLDAAVRVAADTRALTIGPARLSESPAADEHVVTWPNYKGASAFLAKLRAEAARPG